MLLVPPIPRFLGNHPFSTAGGPIAFVLREQVSQIFHSGGREGNRLLIFGAMDPRDSRSPDASRRLSPTRAARPRPRISAARLMVNAKAGAAISGSAGDRHHLARQFHGRSSAR